MSEKLFSFSSVASCVFLSISYTHTDKTDLLSPASTINCPWGLQKILLACCLSNISVRDKVAHLVEAYRINNIRQHFLTRVRSTHLWARSCRCSWRDRRRRWSSETRRGGQQTCCRLAPMQMLWCFLRRKRKRHQIRSVGKNYKQQVCIHTHAFLPFISTTSTGTCFSLIRKISKLVTTPWERIKIKCNICFASPPSKP